jgi:RNA polymerase sigma-70 factor (ECF subfamily)
MSESFDALMEAARQGSTEALGALLEAYRRDLLALAGRQRIDPALRRKFSTSDLVQETMLCAGREFERFRGSSEGELAAWLRTILEHLTVNAVQHFQNAQKRRVEREVWLDDGDSAGNLRERLILDTPSPATRVAKAEEEDRLLAALAHLPEDQRAVIRYRDFDGRSWEEIGALMGRPPNAARALWYRALVKLRQQFGVSAGKNDG